MLLRVVGVVVSVSWVEVESDLFVEVDGMVLVIFSLSIGILSGLTTFLWLLLLLLLWLLLIFHASTTKTNPSASSNSSWNFGDNDDDDDEEEEEEEEEEGEEEEEEQEEAASGAVSGFRTKRLSVPAFVWLYGCQKKRRKTMEI